MGGWHRKCYSMGMSKQPSFRYLKALAVATGQPLVINPNRLYSCRECELSFKGSSLKDGKLPPHTFCGKPCTETEPW